METLGVPLRIATSMTSTIAAADGIPIAITRYAPAQRVRGVVVINAATGVRRRYYDPFATHLAAHGFAVVTYDYRGIGDSGPHTLRGFVACMRDWGELDQPAVIAHATAWQPSLPLTVIGHSVGGQIFGLLRDPTCVSRVLLVAAQHNYYGLWPLKERLVLWSLWTLLMPAVSHILGYFPSSKVGLGQDLPKGVALEWARWCRSPGALVQAIGGDAAERFARFRGAMLALSFEDDNRFAPRRAAEALLGFYRSASIEHRHLSPESFGMSRVGHFGFFRQAATERGWPIALEWLAAA
jgi:predicted alpha/beta hydrolase